MRRYSDRAQSAASATGVAQRDSIAPSQRSTAAAVVTFASARTCRGRSRSRRRSPERKGRRGSPRRAACVLRRRSPKPVDRTSDTRADGRETRACGLGRLRAVRRGIRPARARPAGNPAGSRRAGARGGRHRPVRPRRAGRAAGAARGGAPRKRGRRLDAERDDGTTDRPPRARASIGARPGRFPPALPSRRPRGTRIRMAARLAGGAPRRPRPARPRGRRRGARPGRRGGAGPGAAAEPAGALLPGLPQRALGGPLPAWDDLIATVEAARAGGAAVHLDGARLWQCGTVYERGFDQIVARFDTVYVSFYSDLRAPAGCALAGPADVMGEARVWQVRHGGRLFSAYPYLLAAEAGLDEVLPRMPDYVAHARALAAALGTLDGISVVPDPPQVAMFHVHARRDAERLEEATLALSEETKTWLASFWRRGGDPATAVTEISIGESSLGVDVREAAGLYAELLTRSA